MPGVAGPSPDASRQAAPRRFGRYDVIAELARGGMGTVYLARHAGEAGFQRLFAVKVLHPHLAEDRAFINMLHDEARLAARIHHPNVVPIFDLGNQDGHYFVVMEYVEGCTLSLLLRRNPNRRPSRVIAQILVDALEGLHAAHTLSNEEGRELNLIHRDISPQNILVGIDGAGHITDFGVAKAETRITATVPGVRKGKIAYMAPEQIMDDGERIDRRVDVFSAGAVLWNALTGLSLFRGENDATTLHNILHKKVPKPSSAGLRPPPFFDEICLRALERDPAQRFQTAQEMAEALRQVAIKNSALGSRTEITEWVTSSFHEEFAVRRRAIREAARKRESADTRTDTSVPALLDISGSAQTGTGPSTTTVSPAGTSHSLSLQVTSQAPSRRGMLILGTVAGLIIAVLLVMLIARPSAPSHDALPSGSMPQPPRAAAAGEPGPKPAGEQAPESPAASNPALASSARASDPSSRVRSHARPEPGNRPAAAPSSRPAGSASEAAKASEKLPQPTREPTVERNPYLRRR